MTMRSLTYLVTVAAFAGCADQSLTPNQPFFVPAFAARQPGEQAPLLTNIPISESAFSGRLSITHIAYDTDARQLLFSGTVTRTSDGLTDSFTDVPGTLSPLASVASATAAIAPAQAGSEGPCKFLVLAIQPLSLDVMGLTLELSIIRIDVNAVPGPGNALGNFLCSVARLLDSAAAATSAIQAQVDKINRALATA